MDGHIQALKDSLSDNPSMCQAPIDVPDLRATLLCMNRMVNEPEIARMIAGFHKDFLAMEVACRLVEVSHHQLAAVAKRPDIFLKELMGYMQYYAKHAQFQTCVLVCLANIANGTNDTVQCTIVRTAFDAVVTSVNRHPQILTPLFIDLVASVVSPQFPTTEFIFDFARNHWRRQLVERMLSDGFSDSILQHAETTMASLHTPDKLRMSYLCQFILYHLQFTQRNLRNQLNHLGHDMETRRGFNEAWQRLRTRERDEHVPDDITQVGLVRNDQDNNELEGDML